MKNKNMEAKILIRTKLILLFISTFITNAYCQISINGSFNFTESNGYGSYSCGTFINNFAISLVAKFSNSSPNRVSFSLIPRTSNCGLERNTNFPQDGTWKLYENTNQIGPNYVIGGSFGHAGGFILEYNNSCTNRSYSLYAEYTTNTGIIYNSGYITVVVDNSSTLAAATISGDTTIISGQAAKLKISFSGTPPWNLTFNGATYSNITSSPQFLQVNPTQTTVYTGLSVSNQCGVTTSNGSATVTTINDSDCIDSLNHTLPITSKEYKVTSNIKSQISIPNGTVYNAGKFINLTPGFSVNTDNLFIAKIEGCIKSITIPNNGLIAHYTFDNNVSNRVSTYNNGTFHNENYTFDRKSYLNSSAANFGLENDNIERVITIQSSSAMMFDSAFTFSFWVKHHQTQAYCYYMSKQGGNLINPNTLYNGKFNLLMFENGSYLLTNNCSCNSFSIVPLDNILVWKSIIITYENETLNYFIDGILVESENVKLDLIHLNSSSLVIGQAYYGDIIRKFSGLIDDFRVYNRALSSNEVQTLFLLEK